MTIREHIIDVAKLSKDYSNFWQNLKTRLGSGIDLIRPETADSLWAKELQKRNLSLSSINRLSGN